METNKLDGIERLMMRRLLLSNVLPFPKKAADVIPNLPGP
jgi:hypothetical protein